MKDSGFFEQISRDIDNINRAVLAGVDFSSGLFDSSDEESMEELCGLLETAGGECVAAVMQKREAPDATTFIGSGKAEEIAELVKANRAGLLVFDNELTPTQIRNLEKLTGVRVLDRSMLILDIFAMRAKTKEGKLQVELAQYQYEIPRLTSSYEELSRLGGGIGTRGPGETKLETDRRYLRSRIRMIHEELAHLKNTRMLQRTRRKKGGIQIASLIGYTNAGKSTIFNLLTREGVLVEDKLFATLDPVIRKIELPSGIPLLVSDTVGFIRKLPHHLVAAFKSTLEEVCFADLLIHVVDVSNPSYRLHMDVVSDLVRELGAGHIPGITVFNKCDRADIRYTAQEKDSVFISAKTGENVDRMLSLIEKKLSEQKREMTLSIPYGDGAVISLIHEKCKVSEISYESGHISVSLYADAEMADRLKKYRVSGGQHDGI